MTADGPAPSPPRGTEPDADGSAAPGGAGPGSGGGASPRALFLRGLRGALATPGFVLWGSYVGFGAMAHDFGWPLWVAALSTLLIWAAPAQLVLAGALASGAGLAGATFAVSISGVRLLPMVIAIMPVIRSERTGFMTRIAAAHFVAVTAWFEGLRLTPTLARSERMAFFFGLAVMLVLGSTAATVIGHAAAGSLPRALAIGLLGLTPMYFLMSLERGADGLAEKSAIGLGLVIGPLIGLVTQEFDLIATGLIGGTAAFMIGRMRAGRAAS